MIDLTPPNVICTNLCNNEFLEGAGLIPEVWKLKDSYFLITVNNLCETEQKNEDS